MIHLFLHVLTKLVETSAQKYHFIILLHLVLLRVFYHTFGIKIKVCKDVKITAGLSIETDFCKLVNHIHTLEGFKTLTNMILGTFRGMICI